jgi:hypothetical protein
MYKNNNVIKLMTQMEKEIEGCIPDVEKFVEGNNSAGTRVRKYMQAVKNLAQEIRSLVQDQTEQGVNIVELAQVMLAMSRETLVDAYGPYVADTYISTQISKLQNDENSLTLH